MENQKELDLTYARMAAAKHYGVDYQEWEEAYVKNSAKRSEKGKKNIDKKSLKKKEVSGKLKFILAMVAMGSVAIAHYHSEKVIANHVYESGVFPKRMGVRDDSMSGIFVSYVDDYGVMQTVNGDAFANMIVDKGTDMGFSVNEMAIALDYCTGYDACAVEGSSLLGRIGEEMKVMGGIYDLDGQINEAISSEKSVGRSAKL